jgi:nitrate/nitrite-specific signal transduction histidine kinase
LCEQGRCTTQEQITAVAQQIKAGAFGAKPRIDPLFALEDDSEVQQWNKDFQRTCENLTALYAQLSEGVADRMGFQSLGLNHQRISCAKDVCKKLDAEVHRCKASQAISEAAHD